MPLDTPPPGAAWRRLTEHREEVPLRVAAHPTVVLLKHPQHGFEVHDVNRGGESNLAEPGLQKVVGRLPLTSVHVFDFHAEPRKHLYRDVMEPLTVVRVERERGRLSLLRGECRNEGLGCSGHRCSRALRGNR